MLSIANESGLNVDCGLHVIKFWAPWCGPCKMYKPVIDKLDEEFKDINFWSVDTDQVPELARRYKITSLPTLVLIKDGEEIQRIIGLSMIKPLRSVFSELVKKDQASEETVELPADTAAAN